MPSLVGDARFATAADRRTHDTELAGVLGSELASGSASDWFAALDAAGVPVEISDEHYSQTLFDDAELYERGWLVATDGHPVVGNLDMVGIGVEFSETLSTAGGPPPKRGPGGSSSASLAFDDAEIDALVAAGAVQAPEHFDPADVSNHR